MLLQIPVDPSAYEIPQWLYGVPGLFAVIAIFFFGWYIRGRWVRRNPGSNPGGNGKDKKEEPKLTENGVVRLIWEELPKHQNGCMKVINEKFKNVQLQIENLQSKVDDSVSISQETLDAILDRNKKESDG